MDSAPAVRLSVCTPTYQGLERLRRTVPVTLGEMGPDDEVIFSVDGSDDGSVEYLRGLAGADPRVRVLAHEVNRGRTVALNAACRAARGAIVLRLDDDILVPPGFFEAHMAAHRTEDRPIGVVQPIVDVIEGRGHRMWRAFVERNAARDMDRFRERSDSAPACVWGPVCSVPREAGGTLDWYDERFSAYGWEDVEFGYRLIESGVPLRITPSTSVEHLVHWQSFEQKLRRGFAAGARMGVFARLHGPEAVLAALGLDARDRVRPRRVLSGGTRALRRSGATRGVLFALARGGERLLALAGWRRAYDWWVARWLGWSYVSGWCDEAVRSALPVIEAPTLWPSGEKGLAREEWARIVATTASLGSAVAAVAVMRSAMLRTLERRTVAAGTRWRHALGSVRRLLHAAWGGGGAMSADGRTVVFFEDATPSATGGLARVADALEGCGETIVAVAAAPYVRDAVRARHGRECLLLDDAIAPAGGMRSLVRAWNAAREVVRTHGEGMRLPAASRVQLSAEAALGAVLYERAGRTEALRRAVRVVAASEYFAPAVALRTACGDLGVPWVTLQHGAVNVMYAPFTADRYLTWSEEAREALARLQPASAPALRVVGSPIEARVSDLAERERLRTRCGLGACEGPVLCVYSQTHGPEFTAATHFAVAAQLRSVLEAVPSVRILLKRHPSESRSAYEDLTADARFTVVPDGVGAAEAARAADVAVALGSTALIDAMLSGCATVEVLSDETLMEQAVSEDRVPIPGLAAALVALLGEHGAADRLAERQRAGRERFAGPGGFDARVVEALREAQEVAARA